MSVKKRLKEYLKARNITVSAFENSINVSNGYVNSISKSIGVDKINTILENNSNLNIEWLFTGNGNMFKEPNSHLKYISSKAIPLIPIEAMAGYGTGDFSVDILDLDTYVVPDFADVDYMIRVKGSSMYPKYNSGDVVACRQVHKSTFIQWNKVYVFDTDQGVLIKRLKQGSTKNTILCISDNKSYDPFEISKKELRSLALVVGVIRLE